MKYAVVLCDGMADTKTKLLNGKTPMSAAAKPTMDALAKKSIVGLVKTVGDGLSPGSDVANLSVMGYNPSDCYTGRSPLEAASIGIDLKDTDVTLRCNLVSLSDDTDYENKTILDYCADDISTDDAAILVEYLQENLGDEEFRFYTGVSYRHCVVWNNGDNNPGNLTPPHDITGSKITNFLPSGKGAKLYTLMKKSYELLSIHPLNLERVKSGKLPANSIWLWGQGTKPSLENFFEKFGKKGSVISAVDLLKGIGICAGMNVCNVEGATGYIDTNFNGKLDAAINELTSGQDFVYIHIEAPDECGHRGEADKKVRSIELIDEKILSPLVEKLAEIDDFSILVLPDHPTPLDIKTHTSDPVPFFLYKSNDLKESGITSFDEDAAASTGLLIDPGHTLMKKFLSV